MKLAFSAAGKTPESALDQRFGRAALFLLYDSESGVFTVIDNTQNLNAAQGAGIQSAQTVVNSGATALVTGHTGPKAFRVLEAAHIAVYLSAAPTVAEALAAWKSGTLTQITGADVEGHWV